MIHLAINQEMQEKVFEELMEVFESDETEITSEHLRKLKYLGRVIKESLRLLPVGAILARENHQPIKLGAKKTETPKKYQLIILITFR